MYLKIAEKMWFSSVIYVATLFSLGIRISTVFEFLEFLVTN